MSEARICDRCDEPYTDIRDMQFRDPRRRDHAPSDLCAVCHKELREWWRDG